MNFELSLKELEKARDFVSTHKCSSTGGTIGGRFTYCFTPTGLGMIKEIQCACGKIITLSSSENW